MGSEGTYIILAYETNTITHDMWLNVFNMQSRTHCEISVTKQQTHAKLVTID